MTLKLFELRDRGTFIPIFAFRCRPTRAEDIDLFHAERFLLGRAGFMIGNDDPHIIIGRLDCDFPGVSQCTYDVHAHTGMARTFTEAHRYIATHWDQLPSGAVLDVEFILGETTTPKVSERLAYPET